jgi:hypothetical protein
VQSELLSSLKAIEEKYEDAMVKMRQYKEKQARYLPVVQDYSRLKVINEKMRQKVYLPKKDDEIDRAISDLINIRPEAQ